MTTATLQPVPTLEGPPDPDLLRVRDLIYDVAGIFHPDNKLHLLLERCHRRMNELKTKDLRDYLQCLTQQASRWGELTALLNEITIGETCFFRNQHQLDALRNVAIPKITEARAKDIPKQLRIWSAGCSTGEEPYTISMVLLEDAGQRLKGWTFEILATDLNENSLAQAKAGLYGAYSVRNVNPTFRQKYFVEVGDQFQLQPQVRTNVSLSRVNLSDDTRMALVTQIDVIFCCNVLIYFDLASKRRVIQHFYESLLPNGYLFLGHAESLFGVNDDFRLVHLPGATAYVKVPGKQVGRGR